MRARVAVALVLLVAGPAAAQQSAPVPNLRNAPAAQQVSGVAYCRGEWDVALADGTTRRFKEYDRVFVVFADLEELRRLPKAACRD